MIRKLKSGEYRLNSRNKDGKTGKRRNLGTFATREAAKNMRAKSNISSGIERARMTEKKWSQDVTENSDAMSKTSIIVRRDDLAYRSVGR